MAEAIEAELITVADANPETLAMYDLIGFGPGIYFGKTTRRSSGSWSRCRQ